MIRIFNIIIDTEESLLKEIDKGANEGIIIGIICTLIIQFCIILVTL